MSKRVLALVFAAASLAPLAVVVQGYALAEAPAPVCGGVSVGAAEVAVSDETRDRLGRNGWPDSGMGVERTESGHYRFHTPDAFGGTGPVNQRNIVSEGTLENPVAHGVIAAAPLKGVPEGYQWAGGGPIWRSPDGTVLKILHLERYAANMFYAELHLGTHDPATGVTTYLGPLVRPTVDFATAASLGQIADVGMSSLTLIDGYLYVYFPDFYLDGSGRPMNTALSVARARAEDVVRAAKAGTVTPWHKYHNSMWNSPGVGGASTDLQPGQSMLWAPHAVRTVDGGVIVVAPINEREVVMTTSRDGVHDWSPRVPLFRDPDRYNAYVTVVGTGSDPSLVDKDFFVYHTQFMGMEPNWSNVQLVRHRVACTAATAPGTTALIRYLDGTGHHRVTVGAVQEPGVYPQFGGVWGLLTAEQPGTHPLYECRQGVRDYFVSRDRGCGGRSVALVRTLGWIYESRPAQDSTPLYRCALPAIADHFVSILADCETPDAVQEGLLGYALATSRTPFSRFHDGKDHWESTDRVSGSYTLERSGWYLENSRLPGTIPLYGCSYAIPGGVNHFISVTSNCEGLTMVRLEGYIHLEPPPGGDYRPLYRCFRAPGNDHFMSTDENCEGVSGAVREGRLGYVALTAGFTV
ncbi:hypothetical protein [Allorhizocola rhizosphaerae]|uniref:hypothetical protein n=1 Tax=Allorhizocola rhizosphaerae TaxID=1872709 RepID=UPI000E3CB6DF|nr:hypothetical protein [Allorhizocola rhizosphaerae]